MPLLGRNRRSESLPTLCTAALQDRATRLGLHPLTETVLSEAFDSTGLKCPLHLCGSSLSRVFRALRVVLGVSLAFALETVSIDAFDWPRTDSTDLVTQNPVVSSHSDSCDSIRAAIERRQANEAGSDADRAGLETVWAGRSQTASAVCSQSHGRPGKRGSLPGSLRPCQCTDFRTFAANPSADERRPKLG